MKPEEEELMHLKKELTIGKKAIAFFAKEK